MKNIKALVCLFLALAIPFILLTGCGNGVGELSKLLNPPDPPSVSDPPDISDLFPPDTGDPEPTGTPPDYASGSFRDAIDDNGFFKGVRAVDYIVMFNYKGLPIPKDVHQVSDEDLQSQIDSIVAEFPPNIQITDRAIQDGDKVNIDYVGSVDGVPFDGGSTDGQGTEVTAGSPDYIDDFLFQIIGHMPGETINVEVTFPDEYPNNPDLAGKPALFVTTINYIAEMDLTDEFVMENLNPYYGWTTVEEMKAGMRKDIQKYGIQQYIRSYFISDVTVKSMPDQLIDYQINSMMNWYVEYAGYYGMELEELISSEGFSSVDELIESYYDMNMESAVSTLVLQAIAEDAGMTVSDDDVANYFLDNNMMDDYQSLVEQYGMPFIKYNVLFQKVMDFIVDNAVLL